ncbi:hypothetical protein V6N13_074649 [Hibiscus sabdariffa]
MQTETFRPLVNERIEEYLGPRFCEFPVKFCRSAFVFNVACTAEPTSSAAVVLYFSLGFPYSSLYNIKSLPKLFVFLFLVDFLCAKFMDFILFGSPLGTCMNSGQLMRTFEQEETNGDLAFTALTNLSSARLGIFGNASLRMQMEILTSFAYLRNSF